MIDAQHACLGTSNLEQKGKASLPKPTKPTRTAEPEHPIIFAPEAEIHYNFLHRQRKP